MQGIRVNMPETLMVYETNNYIMLYTDENGFLHKKEIHWHEFENKVLAENRRLVKAFKARFPEEFPQSGFKFQSDSGDENKNWQV